MIRTSVIIPTYNRPGSLKRTLNSIFNQSVKPKEIIIIDDSDDDKTKIMLDSLRKKNIIYIKKKNRGTTKSRNLGIDHSKGEVIFFLDDDVVIFKDYIESTLDYFKNNPKTVGVQWFAYSGHEKRYSTSKIKTALMRTFSLSYHEKNVSKVLPNMNVIIPKPLTKDIPTEFMGSGTCAIKKRYLDVRFDERLTGYALQEDLDWSYRLYKRYGNLFLLKKKKLYHYYSLTSRMYIRQIIFTKLIYLTYIFQKNQEQKLLNLTLFWWSMIGRIILKLLNVVLKPKKSNFMDFVYTSLAVCSLLKHFREIKENPNYFKEE